MQKKINPLVHTPIQHSKKTDYTTTTTQKEGENNGGIEQKYSPHTEKRTVNIWTENNSAERERESESRRK